MPGSRSQAGPTQPSRGRPHHHHQRRHSWPPLKLLHNLPHFPHSPRKPPIDEEPLSYFLSPMPSPSLDSGTYIYDYMNASIGDATPSRARSLSPQRSENPPYFQPSPSSPTTVAIARLRTWMHNMEEKYFYRRPRDSPSKGRKRRAASLPPDTEMTDGPTGGPVSPPRGRKTLRRSQGSVRLIRGHSGRPRVWQLPDEGLWPVLEDEHEDEPMGLGIST